MRFFLLLAGFALLSIKQITYAQPTSTGNKELNALLVNYYQDQLKLFPTAATSDGDNRYNDLLYADFTDSYRSILRTFYSSYLSKLKKLRKSKLNHNDQLTYHILNWRLTSNLEGLELKTNRIPFTQLSGIPLSVAQWGSGTVIQPFKNLLDYENWILRATAFSVWADSAIVYFKKGIAENLVLPKTLVVKMIPQMESFVTSDISKSVFYGPVNNMPAGLSLADKKRLTVAYEKLITQQLIPAYLKLANFLKNEYLPASRKTSGIGVLPGGNKLYTYAIKLSTTTNVSADKLFNTGLAEVKRIRAAMEKVKTSVVFKGSLNEFFQYMQKDPKFFPYKQPEEILNDYRAIENKIAPNLDKLFLKKPTTPFEIRQTESFRAASAAAQYFPGLPDGSRPGIFYLPIVDVTKMGKARESLFIHEAIPGHHYQIMLQKENKELPAFRQNGVFTSYVEGWGLYSESLGAELGLYTDPFQRMYSLGDEIHRAIRLVVDPGMHSKGWTREQAIKYMVDNESISEIKATAEIERYMAIPGQAVAYKVGEMKIRELRNKYEKKSGTKFNLAGFHDAVLKDGSMPLEIFEKKMNDWAKGQK